jgi:hypothetical protein
MKPEIEAYLRQHGGKYTTKALRKQLLLAGHDEAEVDEALRETEATRAPQFAETRALRGRFWRWVLALHLAVLLVFAGLSLVIGSFATGSWGLLVILAVVLLIGVLISGLIGRGVLGGSGLAIAMVVPAISALLIGGSCLALGGSYLLQAPPKTGVMELHIDPPLSFDGSGPAHCQSFGSTTGFLVWADDVGTLDGKNVNVSLDASTRAQGQAAAVTNLSIGLNPQSGTDRPVYYSTIFSTRTELDASPDGFSGTLRFEALEPGVGEAAPGGAPGLEPISGTITWTCG